MRILIIAGLLAGMTASPVLQAEEDSEPESFAEQRASLDCEPGLLETCVDAEKARVLLILPAPEDKSGLIGRYIYQAYLSSGLGSNPLGLDRTVGGGTQILAMRRVGEKILFEVENWRFRATDGTEGERLAVRESFAWSVLWAGKIAAVAEDGRLLLDIGPFLLRDALGVAARIEQAEQGSFSLDADRSVVEASSTLVFPDNIEMEASLTFAGTKPGDEIRQTAPEPTAVTLVQHHSLVRLPEPGYEARRGDPRAGAIENIHYDYATPLSEPLATNIARRHRLERIDPAAASGPVKEPIVYYLDSGAPEPVKSALLDGARWWADAFEAAGFENAFEVRELPPGAHRLDVRYNIITWVHRATRGWSYGASVLDPRTGEIIKGYVLLGSQRVRQDRLIFEGLAGTGKTGTGAADDPIELALARIRQLSAHEVGHTIGLAHNFGASANDRASVMDYPAPWVRIGEDGGLDFSQAYDAGIGAWDRFAIDWLYRQYPPGTDVAAALDAKVLEAREAGLIYVTDEHGRGVGTAHPLGAVWDNGSDPIAALEEAWAVRNHALANFGPDRVAPGRPLSQLRRVLVPIYLYHRYQVDAASKSLAGASYDYRLRGGAGQPVTWVDAETQNRALDALLATLDPGALDLPDELLADLAPFSRSFYTDPVTDRELFPGNIDPLFDPVAAAAIAGRITIRALVNPARAARLVEQHRREPGLPSLEQVLDRLQATLFDAPRRETQRQAEIRRALQAELVEHLIGVALSDESPSVVAFRLESFLVDLAEGLEEDRGDKAAQSHARGLARRVDRFLDRPSEPVPALRAPAGEPPGSPIGSAETCWHCDPLP
ncbi:MAG: zinc-dependent metalloprotease [Xanthomonadales bacterium]|nr:zinc-dependent metalloprotease [Xanthomonadales bacterium]